jgi:hypothetical protein
VRDLIGRPLDPLIRRDRCLNPTRAAQQIRPRSMEGHPLAKHRLALLLWDFGVVGLVGADEQ